MTKCITIQNFVSFLCNTIYLTLFRIVGSIWTIETFTKLIRSLINWNDIIKRIEISKLMGSFITWINMDISPFDITWTWKFGWNQWMPCYKLSAISKGIILHRFLRIGGLKVWTLDGSSRITGPSIRLNQFLKSI